MQEATSRIDDLGIFPLSVEHEGSLPYKQETLTSSSLEPFIHSTPSSGSLSFVSILSFQFYMYVSQAVPSDPNCGCISRLPTHRQFYPSWYGHPNHILWIVPIMKRVIIKFSAAFCYMCLLGDQIILITFFADTLNNGHQTEIGACMYKINHMKITELLFGKLPLMMYGHMKRR
jgi:hypothetical protein